MFVASLGRDMEVAVSDICVRAWAPGACNGLQSKLGGTHAVPTAMTLGIIETAVFQHSVSTLRILPRDTPVPRGPPLDGVTDCPMFVDP